MKNFKSIFALLCLLVLGGSAFSQAVYWLSFTDKVNTGYHTDRPDEFLSKRALARREKQMIPITEQDLPVSSAYINELRNTGCTIRNVSKWFNGAMVDVPSDSVLSQIAQLPYITSPPILLRPNTAGKRLNLPGEDKLKLCSDCNQADYGNSFNQIEMLGLEVLHDSGYWGGGMRIAVLDAGFRNADKISSLQAIWQNEKVVATKDFVKDNLAFFDSHEHGTAVLSIMAGWNPGRLIGSAPAAEYVLIRTEDAASEYLIEEYNWLCGAEYADSIGANIINSSLGYSEFDLESQNHRYLDMDGATTPISRAADIAASKGILVVTSAGNSGDDPWYYITAPADAKGVLTVGATEPNKAIAFYSSHGPSSDGRVKPDVSAQGFLTLAQHPNGSYFDCNGTSCSSPLIAGMAACLWQAQGSLNVAELRSNIIKSSHQYEAPDNDLGYGIPNMIKSRILLSADSVAIYAKDMNLSFHNNPVQEDLLIKLSGPLPWEADVAQVTIVNSHGIMYHNLEYPIYGSVNHISIQGINQLPSGHYFLKVQAGGQVLNERFFKLD